MNQEVIVESSPEKKSYTVSQLLGLIVGIALFIIIYFVMPIEGLSQAGKGVLATLALMASWWLAESINTGITGLVPLILFPLTGALSAGDTAAAYGNNTIFMFFGGFAISLALERWNLHNRIALTILKYVGTSINRLIMGLLIAGGFLSMWVSNTATILMLLPIATAVANNIGNLMKEEENYVEGDETKFRKAAVFAVGFGAIIGGSTTLIGTPTNMILAGFAPELLGAEVPFGQFMIFMIPISAAQYLFMNFFLTKVMFKFKIKDIGNAKEVIEKQLTDLGKPSIEEKIVFTVFLATVFMWLSRSFLFENVAGLSDTVISIVACIILYAIPTKSKGIRILEGDSITKYPWGVILMLMGGMAIAAGFTQTDLASYLGTLLLQFENTSLLFMILIITTFGLAMTQVAPNTATSTILVPIAASIGETLNLEPFYLMLAASLGPGFSTTMPAGTPLMGIIYSTGDYKLSELVKAGGALALVSLPMIVVGIYFWAPIIFGI